MKKKRLPVVYVEWIDSQTWFGWKRPDLDESGPCIVDSVGMLIHDQKDFITLSTSLSRNGGSIDQLSIPRCAITKIKRVKV